MTTDDERGDGFSAKDQLLMFALARGLEQEEAAKVANTSLATVTRRMRDPLFRRGIADQRDLMIERAVGIASGALSEAFETLAKIFRDDGQAPTPRVAAASKLAELALRYRSEEQLVKRIEELERAFAERTGPVGFGRAS